MKKFNLILILSFVILFSCNNNKTTDNNNVRLLSKNDSISYSLGVDIASSVKQSGLDTVNTNAFAKGFNSVLDSSELLISKNEAHMYVQRFFGELQQKQREKQLKKFEKNIKIGEDFLAENAKNKGVITTSSGLQYKIIKKGTGKTPTINSMVTVDYEGRLINGTIFDSSYKTGKPVSFPVKGVIPGWTEVLQLMKEGSVWEVYIPQELAYGANSPGGAIEPYSTLIFKIELKKVENQKK